MYLAQAVLANVIYTYPPCLRIRFNPLAFNVYGPYTLYAIHSTINACGQAARQAICVLRVLGHSHRPSLNSLPFFSLNSLLCVSRQTGSVAPANERERAIESLFSHKALSSYTPRVNRDHSPPCLPPPNCPLPFCEVLLDNVLACAAPVCLSQCTTCTHSLSLCVPPSDLPTTG